MVSFIQMMSLTFGLFTQVSGSGPLGPLVFFLFVGCVYGVQCVCMGIVTMLYTEIFVAFHWTPPLFQD